MSFLVGLGIGFTTAFITGPVFFTLLKNAIQGGRNAGIASASGIIFSDILVFFICYFAAGSLIEQSVNSPIAYVLAGIIMLAFGLRFMIKPVSIEDFKETENGASKGLYNAFGQGFVVNFVNPVVFVIWTGFIALGEQDYSAPLPFYLFILGIFIGIFSTDLLKVIFAQKVRSWLKNEHLKIIYRIIGGVLAIFAVRLFWLSF